MGKTKQELFLELAKPNEKGVSRWVDTSEFIGAYAQLKFGNGASWARKEGSLAKKYIIEFDKSKTSGNGIDRIRLNGFNDNKHTQLIKALIKKEIKKQRCVVLGTSNPEIDHKNGRKNDDRIMTNKEQEISDFQPLSKAANDAKRQFCKDCKKTGLRYDAKKLGYPMSYYKGNENHDETESGCEGCYWYDPMEFKKHLREKKQS